MRRIVPMPTASAVLLFASLLPRSAAVPALPTLQAEEGPPTYAVANWHRRENASSSVEEKSAAVGPTHVQQLLGVSILNGFFASLATLTVVPFESKQKSFFPELAADNGGEYLHNDELRGFGVLMLAYTANVYWFKNGANAHTGPDGHTSSNIDAPEIANFFPSFGAGYGQHWCSAHADPRVDPPNFDNDPEFSYSSAAEAGAGISQTHDTQAAIYTWRRLDDTLITLAFRGSETPALDGFMKAEWNGDTLARFVTSLDEVARDWVGSDLNVAPMDDQICGHPDVELHNGITLAYLGVRSNVIAGLQEAIRRATAAGQPIKIFVTGHSLGAALANLATYDLWCNKETHLNVDGVQHELFGTITFGHFFTLWKLRSVEVFAETVPVTKRMRINACAQTREGQIAAMKPMGELPSCNSCGDPPPWHDFLGAVAHAACVVTYEICNLARSTYIAAYDHLLPNHFGTCDVVGGVFRGIGPLASLDKDQGYFHPVDNDFQVAWVNTHTPLFSWSTFEVGGDCYGAPNGFFCHLLERYSQGMRRSRSFNTGGQCTPVVDPDNSLRMLPEGGDSNVCYRSLGRLAAEEGNNVGQTVRGTVAACEAACSSTDGCASFTYKPASSECYLKDRQQSPDSQVNGLAGHITYYQIAECLSNIVSSNVPAVGAWGGTCTCPDGQTYQVGDNVDSCGSLACIGGISGVCGPDNPGGNGVRVTCA